MNLSKLISTPRIARSVALAAGLGLVAAQLTGCSSTAPSTATTPIASQAVSVPVLITDAPSDQLVAFSLTLNSIILTDSAGKTASILSTPTTIEICHLNGIQQALITASVPEDTYVSALIAFSDPQITYIDSSGQPVVASPVLATTSYTAAFASPIVIANSSSSLLFDLLAAQSVAISGSTVTVTPIFSVKAVPSATAVPTPGQNGSGMQQIGAVVSVSGTTLVIEPGNGPNITLTTNSSTVLQGFSSLSALVAGDLVQVDFIVETGGVLLATRIQLAPSNPGGQPPNLLDGPVTAVTAGSGFKMALMQGLGPALSPTAAGTIYTIATTASTTFAITPQFVSLSGLPFTPAFTAATLAPGQTVSVIASSVSTTAATAAATSVYLIPQTIAGTVTAIATSGAYTVYTFTLASGSAFASLSGASTVTVYTSTSTVGMSAAPIAVGSQVRFNGLIFNTSGTFKMVAAVCPDGAPGV